MKHRHHLVVGLLAVCTALSLSLATPAVAQAQDAPSRTDRKAAQNAFDAGSAYYEEGEYGKAITEFKKGYRLAPSGMFLYNTALCYVKLGDYENAVEYSRRTVSAKGVPDRVAVRNHGRLQALEIRVKTGALTEKLAAVAKSKEDEPSTDELLDEQDDPSRSEGGVGTLGWAGIGTATAGVGLLVTSGIIASSLGGRIDELEQTQDRATYDRRRSDIESDRQLGRIALYSGAGLLAVGAGLFVWDMLGSGESSRASVGVTPGLGGAAVDIRFRW